MATKDYTGCDKKTVKVNRGEPVKAVCCLENVSTSLVNLEVAIAATCCFVELGDGESKVRLSFYFEPEEVFYSMAPPPTTDYKGRTKYSPNVDSYYKTLSLCCTVLSGGEGRELQFIVELDKLNEMLQYEVGVMSEKMITIGGHRNRQKIIVGKRILPYLNAQICQNGSITNEKYVYASTNDLCFGISVTQIESTGQGEVADRGGELAVGSPEVTLAQNLKDMLNSHEFFSDLKLQTKDGVETSTHKFIVAARSPVLKEIIEKESAKESFNGTVKIPDFNAKPIIAILHWMYSGRLNDTTGNVIEDVVVAAKKYQLTDMMKQLDKEMITVCNTGNMFQLFEAARQNHLPIAILQISAFIKENIGTMVPHA
ncbi:unnamed protein product [Orchesella dallaii]|uniref:BTB domain-containing protein n=1 Tax=Orchesella dallaii TaxID=48710 RepID=A0ABP1PMZ4_9HEXA